MYFYTPEQRHLFAQPGSVVAGRYRTSRLIGHTQLGTLLAAEDTQSARRVHLEFMVCASPLDARALASMRLAAACTCAHPSEHVARIYGVEEEPHLGLFLVREALEGELLQERIRREGSLPFDEVHSIVEQILAALVDSHGMKMADIRLTPAMVFLESPGAGARVKLLDWGLPPFMPSENLTTVGGGGSSACFHLLPRDRFSRGSPSRKPATYDVYACAAIGFHALTGGFHVRGTDMLTILTWSMENDAMTLSDVMGVRFDPRIEAYMARALSRDPDARFGTATEALSAWRALRP
jgi:eukaryotic-like serine/threonine-protein kinase